jgi:hypothetical protein
MPRKFKEIISNSVKLWSVPMDKFLSSTDERQGQQKIEKKF